MPCQLPFPNFIFTERPHSVEIPLPHGTCRYALSRKLSINRSKHSIHRPLMLFPPLPLVFPIFSFFFPPLAPLSSSLLLWPSLGPCALGGPYCLFRSRFSASIPRFPVCHSVGLLYADYTQPYIRLHDVFVKCLRGSGESLSSRGTLTITFVPSLVLYIPRCGGPGSQTASTSKDT